jgi:NADH-quinone oxidoreductase subunit N
MNFLLMHQNHFKMFLPEVFLATSILVMTLHASLLVTSKRLGYPILTLSFGKLSILVLFLTFLLVYNNPITFMLTYQNTFIFDVLTANVKQIILISTICCLFIFEDNLVRQQINNFEYFILILSAVLGLLLLVSSYDLISLYLSIEMQSLCLYVLAASKKDSSFSTEAGLKYFLLGSFSSALLLFGMSILYGCTGTTNFENYTLLFSGIDLDNLSTASSISTALIFIGAAFFFKIAAAPFHMWSPDVYEGSPTSSTIFFAVIPKIALFAVFARMFQTVFAPFEDTLLMMTIVFSICSVIVGSFAALRQRKLKRLLAYSSVSHVGYLLLAFSANSVEGTQALFFYLIVYMITSLSFWSVVLSINTSTNTERSKTLIDFASVSTVNPLIGLTGMMALFSLAGVPPLVGFYAKMAIFLSAIGSSLIFVSLVAILASVVSSVYYIRLIKIMYFEPKSDVSFVYPVSRSCSLMMATGTFLLIYLFVNPTLLVLLTSKMALCLY